MHTYIFEGVVTALTSISHIGENQGINAMLRREKIVLPTGGVEEVPVVSGNSIRGVLRDRGMLHMLKTLGYGVDEQTGEFAGISLAAFYFLLCGGVLTKTGARGIDIDEARRWRLLIPLVSLFGGAMGNQIMRGKVKIDKLIPICQETAHLLPSRFLPRDLNSIWDLCQQEAYTRKDDEKDERLRYLIDAGERRQLELLASGEREAKRKDANLDVVTETGQKQQMRYYIETLAAGTQFFWSVVLDDVTSLEFDAFCVVLAEFSRFPYIGGKSSIGHGKVSLKFDKGIEIDPRLAPAGRELDFTMGQRYMAHLEQNATAIQELIHDLA
jgi:CRISPR type IV-associated protein Csf2